MTISVKTSPRDWPDRILVTHRLYPDSNVSATIALTEADVDDLMLYLEEWKDQLRRERSDG